MHLNFGVFAIVASCSVFWLQHVCDAQSVNVTEVAYAAELQSAFNNGQLHVRIVDHLDGRGLPKPQCPGMLAAYAADAFLCLNDSSVPSTATTASASIVGHCESAFTGELKDVTLPPLSPNQCVIVVEQTWMSMYGTRVQMNWWIHNVHVVRQESAELWYWMMFITARSSIWISQSGMQCYQGKLCTFIFGYGPTKITTMDVFLGTSKMLPNGAGSDGAVIAWSPSSVELIRTSFSDFDVGSYLLSARGGNLACQDCVFSESVVVRSLFWAFDPGRVYSDGNYTYENITANVNPPPVVATLPLSAAPAGSFLGENNTVLQAIMQEVAVPTALPPPPPPPPPDPELLQTLTISPSPQPPPPPAPVYDKPNNLAVVSSGEELQAAVGDSSPHILIVEHLDMVALPRPCEAFTCVGPQTYPDVEGISILGECPNTFTRTPTSVKPSTLLPYQCVVVVNATWIVLDARALWMANLHIVVDITASSPIQFLVLVRNGARMYATQAGLQGNKAGTKHLVYVADGASTFLIHDGYLADAGNGTSYGPAIFTYGYVSLNLTILENVVPFPDGAAIVTSGGGIECIYCKFDVISTPALGLWESRTDGVVYTDVLYIVIVVKTQEKVESRSIPEKPEPNYFPSLNDPQYRKIRKEAGWPSNTGMSGAMLALIIIVTIIGTCAAACCVAAAVVYFVHFRKHGPVGGKPDSDKSQPRSTTFDVFLTHEWVGEDGRNHARVQRVHQSLGRLGVKSWFDESEMKGHIHERMAEGIESSAGVLVFMTQRYHDKVVGNNPQDNCKFEFSLAMNWRLGRMVAVVMEKDMRDASKWRGILGGLAMNLYVSLVEMDTLSDTALDKYLEQELLPQMTWLAKK